MTALTDIARREQRFEYFICIEGVGWPENERSANGGANNGFNGRVFATADLEGDLATALAGNTYSVAVHTGLSLPDAIGDEIDPLTLAYKVSGMNFQVQDTADRYLLSQYSPYRTPTETTLDANWAWESTTVPVTAAPFATGDVVWIGGREAVKLGAASGTSYPSSVRGYLGTQRGRASMYVDGAGALTWLIGTSVSSVNRFIYDRRVRLYAHVPGDATGAGCILLYSGRLRGLSSDHAGLLWSFETVGEQVSSFGKKRKSPTIWSSGAEQFVGLNNRPFGDTGGALQQGSYNDPNTPPREYIVESEVSIARISMRLWPTSIPAAVAALPYEYTAPFFFYTYRTMPGGVAGVHAAIASAQPREPQAETIDSDEFIIDAYMQVGDVTVRALKRFQDGDAHDFLCEPVGPSGELVLQLPRGPVRFLIDNLSNDYRTSRYAVNLEVRRHPIDVLLMHLTSLPAEIARFDATNASSASAIKTATQYADNIFAGYALHCVEGNNKGQARKIVSHAYSGGVTTFTIERDFDSGTIANGDEYQVRNTLYDVLPLSWGVGIDAHQIDVDSFEEVRDTFLGGATLGKFVLGTQDTLDLLGLLQSEICQAYGLVIFVDRQTGKLSCRYVGEAYGDGVIDDYIDIPKASILEVGGLEYGVTMPLSKISVKTRAAERRLVGVDVVRSGVSNIFASYTNRYETRQSSFDGKPEIIELVSPDLQAVYEGVDRTEIEISAMLNSVEDCGFVVSHAYGRLRRQNTPPPMLPLRVELPLLAQTDLQAGGFVSITHDAIADAYDGEVGLTARQCRILSSRLELKEINPGVSLKVELLDTVAGARIAPAGLCIGTKGSDSNGQYLFIDKAHFVADPDNDRDHWLFAVGDEIGIYTREGALRESLGTITGFGSSFVADPTAAVEEGATVRVYVSDASITTTIASDDVIKFRANAASSARMDLYSKYSKDDETLTDGSTAREYGG